MRPRRGIAALLLAAWPSSSPAQAPPVFRAEVSYTYVDVFVSDGGRSVPGLRATDFELRDDGVPQEVELLSADARPLQATLVFDRSSSVMGSRLLALRGAGNAFLDGLQPANEISLILFSEEVFRASPPSVDKEPVRRALERLEPSGSTSVFDALYAALLLADPGGRSLIVLFTDGADNLSVLGPRQLKATAERANALVHVVVYQDPGERPVETDQNRALRQIAESSGGRAWNADSPERLRESFAAIAAQMSERYVLRYEPQRVKPDGWHRLDIRLRTAKGTVSSRRGYWRAP